MYPSSINRALCSDGMRCIKPLAPSRKETNSSRVNIGADVVILEYAPQAPGIKRHPPHIPASPQDSFSALAGVGQPSGQRAPAGSSGSAELESVGGRCCTAPVVSPG